MFLKPRWHVPVQNLVKYPPGIQRLLKTVADLGGAVGGNCPPLSYENSAWRPIFGKKGGPYPRPNAFFFSRFVLDVGNM